MASETITTRLQAIYRDVFKDDALVLRPEMTASDIAGWDSLRMVKILIAVETSFAITFKAREIQRLRSVGDFIDGIALKVPLLPPR